MFVKYSPSPETAGLETPKNIFKKQNEISDDLQDFQTRYSRYLRCQNDKPTNRDCPFFCWSFVFSYGQRGKKRIN